MRIAILVVMAAAFGAVLGMLGARSTLAPQLETVRQERDSLQENTDRLRRDLSMATERMQWVEVENVALRDQVDALQRTSGTPPSGSSDQADNGIYAEADAELEPEELASEQRPGESGYIPPEAAERMGATREVEEVAAEQERERVEDMILREIDASMDPVEQERLAVLHEHLVHVRDLYRELREAESLEERQEILNAVGESRRNMRSLVQNQQHDLMRRTFESAGVDDPEVQQQLIHQLDELQNSPYWTEPMMVWGMAADRRPSQ